MALMKRYKNVLFCTEGPIYEDENGGFYGRALNNAFFQKYYSLGEELTVCIRVRTIHSSDAVKQFTPIDQENKRIVKAPNMMSVHAIFEMGKVKQLLSNEISKSDLIVVRVPSVLGNMAASIARGQGKPYLADVVGCARDIFSSYSLFGKFIAGYMYSAQKKTVLNADYALYVSSYFLQERYPSKGISAGVSDVMLPTADEEVLGKRIHHIQNHSGKFIIGTAAAVNVKYKGQERVIEALGNLKKRGITHFEYQLAGGGSQEYLKAVAKKYDVEEQVRFLGSLPHNQVFEWLDAIDVYIQPSYTEGLCRAIIEAMSRGTPCIVTDAGGNRELIDDKWVYPKEKSVKSLEKMLYALNGNVLKEMALVNYSASKHFQKENLEKQRNAFYDLILCSK